MNRRPRMLPAVLTVGSMTMLSRVFGLVRDMMLAAFLGSGPVAQAFLVAFTLPNMFRRFFAEGAFNVAFIPMFAKKVESNDDPKKFAQDAFSALSSMLIVFTLLGQLVMPWLVWAMASGFAGDERFELSVVFGRIAFPYILFISLAAMMAGILNSLSRFAIAAASPVLMNLVMIFALLLGDWTGGDIGAWLIWSTPVAGIVQFLVVWIGAAKVGFVVKPAWPKLTPDVKRLAIIAFPAMLTGSVTQVNLIVGRQVGSFFDGAVAWLSYADRLYHLPIGLVGVAIAVVLLPDLSRRLRAHDIDGSKHAMNRALEFSLFLTLPSSVALIVIPEPIISVLFQRGEFTAADSQATALALMIFGFGLPSFLLQRVFTPMYYVREDTRSPLKFAFYALLVNAVVAIGLAPLIGFTAAAIGPSLSGWTMMLQLWWGTKKMGVATEFDDRMKRSFPRIVAASLVMGVVLYVGKIYLDGPLHDAVWRYFALTLLVSIGGASYAITSIIFGAVKIKELRSAFRRHPS